MKQQEAVVGRPKRRRRFAVTAGTIGATMCVAVSTLLGTTPATALSGGTVDNNPAIVSVGAGRCTGVQVSDSVVLTAAHCSIAKSGFIYVGANGWYNPDDGAAIDRISKSSNGDVAVVHLAEPHPLASYPRVNLRYTPNKGDSGVIYGTGAPNGGQQRTAAVSVVNSGEIIANGPTVQVSASGAYTDLGDSGGPLIVDGAVVGVLYGGYDNGNSWYSMLSSPENAALIASELPGVAVGNVGGVSTAPYYEIKNVGSGLALDSRGSTVGAPITQEAFTGATSQQWTLIRDETNVRIVNRQSGQVIGVPAGSHTAGERTVQWSQLGVTDQAWSKVQQQDGTFTFTNGNSGQVLSAHSTSAGGYVVQDPASGSDAEKWTLVRVG